VNWDDELGTAVKPVAPVIREFKQAGPHQSEKLPKASQPDKPFFLYFPFNAVHSPQEASDKYQARFPHITDRKRRAYAGMLSALDDAIGSDFTSEVRDCVRCRVRHAAARHKKCRSRRERGTQGGEERCSPGSSRAENTSAAAPRV
jgi:hypothetical protein